MSDEARERIATLLKEGRTTRDVAEETEASKSSVANVRREIEKQLPELCKCGRENGHRGKCLGGKVARINSKHRLSKPTNNMHENIPSGSSALAKTSTDWRPIAIAELKAKATAMRMEADGIDAAIRILEGK